MSASSGEEGPEITLTERLITRLWRAHLEATEGGGVEDEHAAALWTNPLLNYTSEPIKEALLSHPSSSQGNEAVELFKVSEFPCICCRKSHTTMLSLPPSLSPSPSPYIRWSISSLSLHLTLLEWTTTSCLSSN